MFILHIMLMVYILIAILMFLFCVAMYFIAKLLDDRKEVKSSIKGIILSPIWPIATMVFLIKRICNWGK